MGCIAVRGATPTELAVRIMISPSTPLPPVAIPDDDRPVRNPRGDSGLGGFEVQPAELRRAGSAYHAEADLLIEAASRLDRHLGTLGQPWGTDQVGARFGATYQPAAQQVTANLGALTVGLIRIASALRAVADSYDVVDHDSASPATRRTMTTITMEGRP